MPGAEPTTTARAWAAGAAGSIAYWQGDVGAARRWYEEQLALAKALDDEAIVADAMFNLGHIMFVEDADAEPMLAWAEDVRQRYRDLGDERAVARIAWSEGTIAMQDGRAEEAVADLREPARRCSIRSATSSTTPWRPRASAGPRSASGTSPTAMRCAVRSLVETNALHDVGDDDDLAPHRGADGRGHGQGRGRRPPVGRLRRALRALRRPAARRRWRGSSASSIPSGACGRH